VLPARAQALAASATRSALQQSLDWALQTLPSKGGPQPRWRWPQGPRFHVAMTATTGAVGGMFGLFGAAVEIPATTTLILRSICERAAEDGFDPRDPATRLHCLSVLSYGSPTLEAMESAYFTSRVGMALAVRDASRYLARQSAQEVGTALSHHTAPVLVRLLNAVATRFEIVISQKLAARRSPGRRGPGLADQCGLYRPLSARRPLPFWHRPIGTAAWRRAGPRRLSPGCRAITVEGGLIFARRAGALVRSANPSAF